VTVRDHPGSEPSAVNQIRCVIAPRSARRGWSANAVYTNDCRARLPAGVVFRLNSMFACQGKVGRLTRSLILTFWISAF
jgi:hypothetical protein